MKFCMFVCIKVLILHSQTETKRDLGGVGYKAGAALPLWPAVGVQILAIIYIYRDEPRISSWGAGDKQIFFFQIRIHIVLINYQPRQILRYNHLPTKTKHTKHY